MKEKIYVIIIFALTIYALLATIKATQLYEQKNQAIKALIKINDEKINILEQQDTTYIVPFHQF
jgi:hypothetical protein